MVCYTQCGKVHAWAHYGQESKMWLAPLDSMWNVHGKGTLYAWQGGHMESGKVGTMW